MHSIPEIRLIFSLIKNDSIDFDREAITQRLHVTPSKTSGPTLSKGTLTFDGDISEIRKDLSGISILPATTPPYQMLKHACWNVELPKSKCWGLDEPLLQLEQIFSGKAPDVLHVCKYYNLSAALIIQVFAESSNMPEIIISEESVCFWSSMGASISFDFYLD